MCVSFNIIHVLNVRGHRGDVIGLGFRQGCSWVICGFGFDVWRNELLPKIQYTTFHGHDGKFFWMNKITLK